MFSCAFRTLHAQSLTQAVSSCQQPRALAPFPRMCTWRALRFAFCFAALREPARTKGYALQSCCVRTASLLWVLSPSGSARRLRNVFLGCSRPFVIPAECSAAADGRTDCRPTDTDTDTADTDLEFNWTRTWTDGGCVMPLLRCGHCHYATLFFSPRRESGCWEREITCTTLGM